MSPTQDTDARHKATILEILAEHRVMSIATLRPDGWPQVTMVGYVADDLTLYCSIARSSQKWANIEQDPRVSIAIGHDTRDRIRGLSMAGRAFPVTDAEEVNRLNALIHSSYPEQAVFAPREAAAVVLRIIPKVVSVIDLPKGSGAPELMGVATVAAVWPVTPVEAEGLMEAGSAQAPVRGVYLSPAAQAGPGPGDLDVVRDVPAKPTEPDA
jgi:nitroimidazol reductase NimA-like FMN-containing flavoprotein (pyridoxamine 5'-phosphate oxidase superfamily)